MRDTHVVFASRETVISHYEEPKKKIVFGVYLDLDLLSQLAAKVSKNKSRKGKDGPVFIEIHSIQDVQQ